MFTKNPPTQSHPHRITPHEPQSMQAVYPQFYSVTVHSRQEQNKMNNMLSWRQKTSMPIVKVTNYTSEQVQLFNSKLATVFKIQLENIFKSVTEMRNLDLGQAAYAVREILLGIQTLSIKFNCQFDISKGFYGIDNKGHVKVWFSNNFINQSNISVAKSVSFSVKNVNSVIENIFQALSPTLKHNHKATFQEIGQRLFIEENLTFAETQNKFRKLCLLYKIIVPNSITLTSETNHSNRKALPSGENRFKRATPISRDHGTSTSRNQVKNFFFAKTENLLKSKQSPMNSPVNQSATQQLQFVPVKPKVTWSYGHQNLINKEPVKQIVTVCNSINRNSFANSLNNSGKKQSLFCRSVPIKMDQKKNSEQRRAFGKEFQEVYIKEFNPLTEQDQILEVSRHIQCNIEEGDSVIKTSKSIKTAESKNQCESKLSFEGGSYLFDVKKSNATTKMSQNTQRGKNSIQQFKEKCYNINRLQEMIDNTKTVVDSIMVPSPIESRKTPESRTTYNFGGLIPIEIGKESQIDGKEAESLEASRECDLKQHNLYQEPKKSRIDFDLLGGIDLMAKFFTTDAKDLKQSVWCGEEKRAQHLQIKLEKLGSFGRQICSSFVPNE